MAPRDETIARRLVLIAERKPGNASRLGRTDVAHIHQALPKPFAIDPDAVVCRQDVTPNSARSRRLLR